MHNNMNKKLILIALALILKASITHAFQIDGLQNAASIAIDPKSKAIFIANTPGDITAKQDRGYISKFKGDGSVDQQKFIDGAAESTTLNSPSALLINNDTIFIADFSSIRAFDLSTGHPKFEIALDKLKTQRITGMTVGPDDCIYAADGPANAIYKIDLKNSNEATIFVSGELLGAPRSIIWHAGKQAFVVASSSSNQIIAFDQSGNRKQLPAIFIKTPEAITSDGAENIYITSSSLGAIFKMGAEFTIKGFESGIASPTAIATKGEPDEIVAILGTSSSAKSFPLQK